jgi:DNA-binding NarL/FixJ family response regulator
MKTIKIILSCSSPLFCEGMAALLQKEKDLEVVGKIEDVSRTMESLEHGPDVLILDPLLYTSEELPRVVRELKARSPQTRILLLFLETETSDRTLMQFMTCGIDGYIKRASTLKHLVEAIRTIHAGNLWAERKLLEQFVQHASPLVSPDLESRLSKVNHSLTKREKEVISFLFLGLPNKHISRELHISEKTVKTHLNNIFKKMNVTNRTQVLSSIICSR